MNRFGIALLALALAATAGGGARLAAADTLPVTAPLVLEYEGSPREGKTHYLIRILQLTPALRAEWEEGFKLGAFAIDGGTLAGSRQYLRLSALENGRDIKLTGTLNLLSQALYDELAGGRRVALRLHLIDGWLERTGEETFELDTLHLPAIAARDSLGRTYLFLRQRDFPLCLRYTTPYYSERLIRCVSDPGIPFKWFKHNR